MDNKALAVVIAVILMGILAMGAIGMQGKDFDISSLPSSTLGAGLDRTGTNAYTNNDGMLQKERSSDTY